MEKRMLGFDIGNYGMKIAVVNGKRTERYVYVPMPDHVVENGQIADFAAAGEFIRDALRAASVKVKKCAVVLPDHSCYIRRVQLPKMTVAQLNVNLPYEFHDYLSRESDGLFL